MARRPRILAATALRDGRADAVLILTLHCVRSAAVMLIIAGSAIALANNRLTGEVASALSTPAGYFRSLVTPLAVLVAGLGLRLLVAPLAYVLAFVFVARSGVDISRAPDQRSWSGRLGDRVRVAGAYRALRWTTAVKQEAVARLGSAGVALTWAEIGLRILAGVAVIAFIVVAARS